MKVAVLQCDNVLEKFQPQFGNYPQMVTAMFKDITPPISFDVFDCQSSHFPKNIDDYDFYITTGSKLSAYDNFDWIHQLIEFTQKLHEHHKKLIGICFGHQIIALALGGAVEKSAKGWGVGIANHPILKQADWMSKAQASINMIVSHQDQVVDLPKNSHVLAGNGFCPNFIVQWGNNFLSIQGHPEWSKDYSSTLINDRRAIIPVDRVEQGLSSLSKTLDSKLFVKWIMDFVGFRPTPTPTLVAHRGFMQGAPENTYRSIKAALDSGCLYVEFDLQLNADHTFMVLHDDNFKRTAGVKQSVFTATTDVCQQISVHQAEKFGDTFNPTPPPTLAEILALIAQYKDATAVVEIKQQSLDHWGLSWVMDKLLAQLTPYAKQCLLISFSYEAIAYTKQYSELKTGWVFEQYTEKQRTLARTLKADFLATDYQLLAKNTPPWPEFKHWMLYDIMQIDVVLKYHAMGVTLIETADIVGLQQALASIEKHPLINSHEAI